VLLLKNNKKKKIEKDWKRIGYEVAGFIFFIFLIGVIIINWQRNEDVKKEQLVNVTIAGVYDKTAEKYLLSGLSYTVLLRPQLLEKTTESIESGYKVAVTKREFDRLDIGDTINGFNIQGVFHTQRELKSEYKGFYFTLFLVGIYPVGYIFYLLFKFEGFEAFLDRHDFGLSIVFNTILWGGLFLLLLFSYREMIADLKNGYEKFYGKDYIETIATITDHSFDHGSGRDNQTYYYLALAYVDTNGEPINLTKEVKRNTFLKYKDGVLPIKYKKNNPYNAFAQQTEGRDILNFLSTPAFFMHCLIIVLTTLLSYALYLMNRKRKTGSYWN